jgi:hypothetical protein
MIESRDDSCARCHQGHVARLSNRLARFYKDWAISYERNISQQTLAAATRSAVQPRSDNARVSLGN